jgi:hypothetical protein
LVVLYALLTNTHVGTLTFTSQNINNTPAQQGFVYVKFAQVEGAAAAQRLLHGRYYMGNQVLAEYQFAAPYAAHFGLPLV